MSLWENRKQSALASEQAATRLDCFLSVVYMFPNCLELDDMEILRKREEDLSKIHKFSGQAFLASYLIGATYVFAIRRGHFPYMKQIVTGAILGTAGTFIAAELSDKLAAELYYNRILMQLVDKYNFTPEEVMDLQRNLNQYYI